MSRHATPRRVDYIKWTLIVGLSMIAVAVGVFLAWRYHWIHPSVTVDFSHYPVTGIDVSSHNGTIDWKQVAAQGHRFAYVKATEGTTFVDKSFSTNVRHAQAAGLKVGAYHYFRMQRDGKAQAAHLLRIVGDHTLDLPLVIDVEDDGSGDVEPAIVRSRLKDMAIVLQRHGYAVMIYTNGNGMRTYYNEGLEAYDLWLSSFRNPDSIAHFGHRFQQYSHWGRADGVSGQVDMNIFMGSETQWTNWVDDLAHR